MNNLGKKPRLSVGSKFSLQFVHLIFMHTMKKPMQLLLILCVVLLSSHAHAAFLMQNLAGERVDLSRYIGQGQWTLLMLWTTDCVPCEEQKPMIEEFHNAHHEANAQVIGLALDGPAKQADIEALISKHDPSYMNLIAFDDVFAQQFSEQTGKSFSVTPTYVFYRPNGELMGVHTGKVSREALESVVAQ